MIRPAQAATLLLAASLTACAHARPPEPKISVQQVRVPVPLACDPKVGPAPAYPDTDLALRSAADLYERVKLLLAGRALRQAREGELTAGLQACAKP